MRGHRIQFSARESLGGEVERILLQAGGTSHEGVDDRSSKEAIRVILAMCAGLLLALNATGTSVRYMKQHQSGDVSKIWVSYLEKLKERGGLSKQEPGAGCSSLNVMREFSPRSSLQILRREACPSRAPVWPVLGTADVGAGWINERSSAVGYMGAK